MSDPNADPNPTGPSGPSDPADSATRRRHAAGLFDIRNIIGSLLTLYGVVVLVTGLIGTSKHEIDRADGINANTWSGIVLLVVGVLFLLWARLRPIVVDEAQLEREKAAIEEAAGRGEAP